MDEIQYRFTRMKVYQIMRQFKFDPIIESELRVSSLLLHNKWSNINKPSATRFFLNKSFAYKVNDSLFWGFAVKKINPKKIDKFVMQIYKFQTKKGNLYFSPVDNNHKVSFQLWTAHFFDRYKERLGMKTRDEAIKAFVKNRHAGDIINGYKHIEYNGKKSVFLLCEEGACLGEVYNDMILFKTFICKAQFKEWQSKSAEELANKIEEKIKLYY